MKAKQRVLALLLSVMMIITYMPAIAFAEEADEAEGADVPEVTDVVQAEEEAAGEPADAEEPSESAEPEVQSEEPEEQVEETEPAGTLQEDGETAEPVEKTQAFEKKRVSAESALPDKNLADNDDLLMDFLYRELSEKTGQSGNMLKARGSSAGSRLSGIDSILYESLKGQITAFVDPEEEVTSETSVFDVSVAEILGKELTQTTINDGSDDIDVYEMSNEDFEAIQDYDGEAVVDALLADMPYELYWFDKTSKYFYGLEPTDYYVGDDCVYFEEEPGIRFTFKVAAGYSVTGEAGTTEFDTSKIQAVKVAVKRAANIIASTAAEGGSDYDKLVSYRESICDMTSYNDAAAQGGINYGDPWQMIYVFDGNAETEVVCEGYSKAFQYLCDNTDFSGNIECVSVTGTMEGGEGAGLHMWNVVTIDDVNYLVDVTNCDEGAVGADDQLFLAGWSDELYDTDDNVVGYRYTCNDGEDDVDYEFDEGQFMTMSDSAYDGEGGQTEEHEISYSTSHVFYEGLNGYGTNAGIYDDNGEFIGLDEYFVYNIDAFEGDVLTIDGESYTYDYGSYAFINDDNTERISRDDVVFSNGDQDNTHWTLDNGNDTEVSYTVNYEGNATTVTAVLSPKPELELTYTREATLTENVDGNWEQAEDGEEKWFCYHEMPLIGDVLTVNGTAYTYQEKRFYYDDDDDYYYYSDWGFYNADMSEKLDETYFGIHAVPYQSESHWVLGDDDKSKDFPVTVTYIGNSVDSYTTVVKNPVQNITYTRNSVFIENKGGYPWTNEDGPFFYYQVNPELGDVITINGDDEYIYKYHYDDDEGYIGFYNSDGAKLENVYFDSDQYEEPWVIPEGQTETTVTFTVQYMGHTVPVEAKLIKNPVTGISYKSITEYTELIQGRDNDPEDPERFRLPGFENGDRLTVSYNNKEDQIYEYSSDDEVFINIADDEDRINPWGIDEISLEADQSEPWTLTGDDEYYEMFVTYEGCKELAKKVKILPNPIESISFNRNGEGQMELIDGVDSYIDDIWGDTGEQIKYFSLDFKLGDRITVNTTDGETDVYEYKRTAEYGKVFVNIDPDKNDYLDDECMYFDSDPNQSPENQWEVNHTYDAVLSYMGITTKVKVHIVPNPVTNVEFERDGSRTLTLYEGVDGDIDWEWDSEEGRIEYFRYNFQGFKKGDSITVTKNGGMNKYVYREIYTDYDGYINAFVNINSDEDIIEADEVEEWDSNQNVESPWTVNTDGYYFVFRYFGFEFQVPVVIAPNPVSGIGFAREGYEAGEDIELTEGLDARINSDGGRDRFFEYYLRFKNGDTIKLTDPDGNTTDYDGVPYTDDFDEVRYFENKATGDRISPDDIDQSSEQSFDNQWIPGDGTHTINLEYFTRTTGVNVTIKENPVREISFSRPGSAGPIELVENGDGYWDDYTFRYKISFKEDDELDIKYAGDPDPVNVKYVATKYPGIGIVFEAEGTVPEGAEQSIDADAFDFRHNCDYQLNVEEDEEASIMLMYQGMWTDVPVTITSNQVESIEYVWKEGGDAVELTEGVDGGNSIYYEDDGDIEVFEYWMPYVNGDILKVKYAGTDDPVSYVYNSENGAFEATGTIPEGAPGSIAGNDIEQASNQNKYNPWEVGSGHEIDITYMGSSFTVPVTIVANSGKIDINKCEVSFNEDYLVNEDIASTEYTDWFFVIPDGEVFEPIVKDGDKTLGPESYTVRYIEQEFDVTADDGDGAWGPKEGAEWINTFPTKTGVYFVEVYGAGEYTGKYNGMFPLVRIGDHSWSDWTVTKEATCTTKGEKERTCSHCKVRYTEEISVDPDAHDWSEPSYAWADDNSTCSASRLCGNNPAHIEMETANAEYKVIKEATETEAGEGQWTATFKNEAFETQTKTVIIPYGEHQHSWGDGVVTVDPTTLSEGVRTYTCSCGETRTEVIDKLEASDSIRGLAELPDSSEIRTIGMDDKIDITDLMDGKVHTFCYVSDDSELMTDIYLFDVYDGNQGNAYLPEVKIFDSDDTLYTKEAEYPCYPTESCYAKGKEIYIQFKGTPDPDYGIDRPYYMTVNVHDYSFAELPDDPEVLAENDVKVHTGLAKGEVITYKINPSSYDLSLILTSSDATESMHFTVFDPGRNELCNGYPQGNEPYKTRIKAYDRPVYLQLFRGMFDEGAETADVTIELKQYKEPTWAPIDPDCQELELFKTSSVTIDQAGSYATVKFTADEDGEYVIRSTDAARSIFASINLQDEFLEEATDSYGYDFIMTYNCTAGTTYYIQTRFSSKTYTGTFGLLVERTHTHDMVYTPAVSPTEDKDGNIAYYTCNVCHKHFKNKSGTTVVTDEEIVIPALGPATPMGNPIALTPNKTTTTTFKTSEGGYRDFTLSPTADGVYAVNVSMWERTGEMNPEDAVTCSMTDSDGNAVQALAGEFSTSGLSMAHLFYLQGGKTYTLRYAATLPARINGFESDEMQVFVRSSSTSGSLDIRSYEVNRVSAIIKFNASSDDTYTITRADNAPNTKSNIMMHLISGDGSQVLKSEQDTFSVDLTAGTYYLAVVERGEDTSTVISIKGNKCEHVASAAVHENEVAATCGTPGHYEEVVYCSKCGAEMSRETKTIPATGKHTEEVIPAVAATCTETGLTAGKKCSVCGEILVAQTETPAKGHTWGKATYTWADDFTSVTGTHSCTVCGDSVTAVAPTASSEVTKAPTTTAEGEITYTSEAFAEEGFAVQTTTDTIPKLTPEQANSQAEEQTQDAEDKASAVENSTDEAAIRDAEDSATQAAALAAIAEEAAQAAYDSAKSVYDNLPENASETDKQTALANYENAVTNLAVAKQLKAAASSAVAKSKKAAAKVAANKAAAAYNSANSAASSAAAEVFRKEAEAQAAIAAEKAGAADNASADAAKAVSDLGKLAEEIADVPVANTVEEAVEAAKTEANTSAGTASEASTAADTSSGNAKTSADKAKEAVNNKAKAEADAAKKAAEAAKPATKPEVVDLKAVKSLKVKGAKGKLTVKWKKATKKELKTFQSYEIQYTLDGTFKDYQPKTVGKKKATVTLKKLLKKKKYTVRIRRVRDDGSVLHVSPWKQKKAKTK